LFEVGEKVFLPRLTKNQPIHRQPIFKATKLGLLTAVGEHGHTTLHPSSSAMFCAPRVPCSGEHGPPAARVEFAVKLPGCGEGDEPVWLPIDAKFPQKTTPSSWKRRSGAIPRRPRQLHFTTGYSGPVTRVIRVLQQLDNEAVMVVVWDLLREGVDLMVLVCSPNQLIEERTQLSKKPVSNLRADARVHEFLLG
jgi:hypothetical protein